MADNKLDLSVLDSLNFQGVVAAEGGAIPTVKSIEDFNSGEAVNTPIKNDEDTEDVIDNDVIDNDPIETDDVQEDTGGDNSTIKAWAEFAADRGLIELDENEEIGDSDDFLVKKFNDRINNVVNEYKESLPEPLKELLDAHEKGIPLEDLMEAESRILEFSAISDEKLSEDVDLQKNIVKAYLKSQDFDDSEIASKLEKYEDNLLLEDEASSALKKLVKLEKRHKEELVKQAEHEQTRRQKEYQDNLKQYTEHIMKLDEIIPGIPVTKEQREAIIKMTTKPVAVLKNGASITALDKLRFEDPDFLPKLAYVAGVLNWDLSSIKRKALTEATRKVKSGLDSTYTEKSPLSKIDLKTIRRAVRQSNNRLFK